jgi:hypothetical protein
MRPASPQFLTLLAGILNAVAVALQGVAKIYEEGVEPKAADRVIGAKTAALGLTAIATVSTLLAVAIKGDRDKAIGGIF